jgi:ABC-type transport system substrate-binding protein
MRKRLVSVFAVSAMIFAACGGTQATASPAASVAAPSGSAAAPASATASAASASADFVFALDGEPTYFTPAFNDVPTSWLIGIMYNGMYVINNKLAPIPQLASALPDVSADGLTWTVKLRSGVTWSDGSPFTSDDVKFSYDLARSPNCPFSAYCGDFQKYLKDVATPDPGTVVLTLSGKFAPFLATDLGFPIIPKAATTTSFNAFQTAAGKADPAAVKALYEKVNAATTADACSGDTPPDTCLYTGYVSDLETTLTSGGIALGVGVLDKGRYIFPAGDPNAGKPDTNSYGTALFTALTDLNTSLTATATDQIAASYRLLDIQQKPVGTGPYKLAKYTAGATVELDRNDTYFAGPVGPAHAIGQIIKDNATEGAALQKGDLNWVEEITSDALAALTADQNLLVTSAPDFGFYFIGMNSRPGRLFADKNLQQAFKMCIDHDATVTKATDGQGVPLYGDIPPASWAFDPNTPKYTLDVAGAKKLIESSGWALGSDGTYAKGGKKLATTLYVRAGRPQRISFAQLAQTQLKECGIDIKVLPADFATVLLPLLNYPNNFDLYLGGFSTVPDPDPTSLFACDQVPTKEKPTDQNNSAAWCNTKADDLLKTGREETDQAKRKPIYAEFETLLHNDSPYYFLWADIKHAGLTKTVVGGTNAYVTDPTIDPTSVYYFWNNDTWSVKVK